MAGRTRKRGAHAVQWPRPSAAAMAQGTLGYWSERYVQHLRERNFSERTAKMRLDHLLHFAAWCELRELYYPAELTRPIIERYQSALYQHRRPNGRPLSFQVQAARLVAIRMYFKWLARQRVVELSPASELELPKVQRRLPRHVLSALEVESVLCLPNVDELLGLRDRAMLEVLYATAIRRAELASLCIFDVDHHRSTLMVREGKGKRDRVVPLGERALSWLEKYLTESRPKLVGAIDEGGLFVTNLGERMSLYYTSQLVKRYLEQAGLGKRGACHLFRHSAATLMLENGADVRFIQQLLGHSNLETTAIYTQVSIVKLKEVHALTHPGARLKPPSAASPEAPSLAASADEVGVDAETLQALLDAEAEREQSELVADEDGGLS